MRVAQLDRPLGGLLHNVHGCSAIRGAFGLALIYALKLSTVV